MKCQHILVPIDFSHDSEHAVSCAIDLGQHFQARLTLLNVVYVPDVPEVSLAYLDTIKSESEQRVEAVRKRVEDAGVAADALVVHGPPSDRITDTAQKQEVDLIVMGTHGRTGLRYMLIGSVAERVVRLAPCPVMVVPYEAGQH